MRQRFRPPWQLRTREVLWPRPPLRRRLLGISSLALFNRNQEHLQQLIRAIQLHRQLPMVHSTVGRCSPPAWTRPHSTCCARFQFRARWQLRTLEVLWPRLLLRLQSLSIEDLVMVCTPLGGHCFIFPHPILVYMENPYTSRYRKRQRKMTL